MKRTLSKFKKLTRIVLLRKTPLLGFTVLEMFILWIAVIGGVVVAVIVTRHQSPVAVQNTNTSPQAHEHETQTAAPTQNITHQNDTSNAPSSQGSTGNTPKSTAPTNSNIILQETKLKIYKTMCIDPLQQSVDTLSTSENQANSKASSEEKAIAYPAGSEQYRTSYNHIAWWRNSSIDLAYNQYLSDVKSYNKASDCKIKPDESLKSSYWNMLNKEYKYVPYVEGSSEFDWD